MEGEGEKSGFLERRSHRKRRSVVSESIEPNWTKFHELRQLSQYTSLFSAKPEEVPADFRLRGVISGDASERYQSAVSMLNNLFTFTEFRCGSAPDLKRHRRDAQCNSRLEEIEKHARIMTNRRLATMEVLDSQYDSFAQQKLDGSSGSNFDSTSNCTSTSTTTTPIATAETGSSSATSNTTTISIGTIENSSSDSRHANNNSTTANTSATSVGSSSSSRCVMM
mmetsp:Transcript_16924/g.33069  ORF Transcript_16924/g.33069 Transcript_16924/m.33069 type:complete len:224 (-) Transcript_16924:75-746(-)